MITKKKIVLFILLTPVFLMVLGVLAFEGVYYYQIDQMQPERVSITENHIQLAQDAYWVSTGETRQAKLESYSVSGFFIRLLVSAIFFEEENRNSAFPVGSNLALQLARNVTFQKTQKQTAFSWHFYNFILSAWASKNHTVKKAINYQLNNANFGSYQSGIKKSAMFYFSKEVENLTSDEILSLIALERGELIKSPPECLLKKLQKRANNLIINLKKYNKTTYSALIYTLPEFNDSANMICEES